MFVVNTDLDTYSYVETESSALSRPNGQYSSNIRTHLPLQTPVKYSGLPRNNNPITYIFLSTGKDRL